MKIHHLEYFDKEYDWKLNKFQLLPDLNLIVGISGAGKTKIIKAILNLREIANGHSLNGIKWDISFTAKDGTLYRWHGEFDTQKSLATIFKNSSNKEDEQNKFRILEEYLYKNNEVIIKRNSEDIFLKNIKTPKLSPFESTLELLSEEEDILLAKQELDSIKIRTENADYYRLEPLRIEIHEQYKNSSLETIAKSNLYINIKLLIISLYHRDIFNKIKQDFLNIFPTTEDLKIDSLNNFFSTDENEDEDEEIRIFVAAFSNKIPVVCIKEKGINNWILENQISSGMFKSLMYISEQYLSPKGSVILIDQFEDGLGVNCIDSVTELLTSKSNDIQFIITSHHPYIINNISPEHWKIVTRKGGIVTVKDAREYHISNSRQKAFIDLINVLEEYPEGMEDG